MTIGAWGTWGGARPSRTALASLGKFACVVLLAALAVGCTDSDDPDADPSAPSSADPAALSVAGEYPTQVEVVESSCPDLAVEPATTTVQQEPGDLQVELTHAGTTHRGTLSANGSFTTSPTRVEVGDAAHSLSLVGRFSSTGFPARVTARVSQEVSPRSCEYAVTWIGVKDGEPNSVPEN